MKKASIFRFTAAVVLVPAALFTACSSDDSSPQGAADLLDGSADARKTFPETGSHADSPYTPPTDSGHDVNAPTDEAGADSGSDSGMDAGPDADAATGADADADAESDADADAGPTTPTSVDDGTYAISAWTCTNGVVSKDVLQNARDSGINEIDQTVAGTVGHIDTIYSGAPLCTRTVTTAIAYPDAGQLKITTATNTCSATCDPGTCTDGTDAVTVSLYDYTKGTGTFTTTRVLDADALTTDAGQSTFPKLAGCAEGDKETVTFTKK